MKVSESKLKSLNLKCNSVLSTKLYFLHLNRMNGFILKSFLIKLLHICAIPSVNLLTGCNKCLLPGNDFVEVGKCATKSSNN